MIYLVDTNILIAAARDYYRFSYGTRYWDWLLAAHRQGSLYSIQQVRDEIEEVDASFQAWLDQGETQNFFLETVPEWVPLYQRVIGYVTSSYEDSKERADFANGADGWLIAAALCYQGTVLTFERPAPQSTSKPKVPTVAEAFQVACQTPWQVYEDLGAQF